jgi:hypothetical protein
MYVKDGLVAVPVAVVIVTGPSPAPIGTFTFSEVDPALNTVAITLLNLTVLLLAVVLNPVPEIVISSPGCPEVGLIDEIDNGSDLLADWGLSFLQDEYKHSSTGNNKSLFIDGIVLLVKVIDDFKFQNKFLFYVSRTPLWK